MYPLDIIIVAFGGGLGAILRFIVSSIFTPASVSSGFPIATLCVNICGCFVAGLLLGLSERFEFLTHPLRLFLFTGILGGFTTFSAFGVETLSLVRKEAWGSAISYVIASVCIGLVAVWLGWLLSREPSSTF